MFMHYSLQGGPSGRGQNLTSNWELRFSIRSLYCDGTVFRDQMGHPVFPMQFRIWGPEPIVDGEGVQLPPEKQCSDP